MKSKKRTYSFMKVNNDKKMARVGIEIPNLSRHLFCILNNRYFDNVEDTFILCLMSEFFSNIFNTKQVVIILIFLQRQQSLFSSISKNH